MSEHGDEQRLDDLVEVMRQWRQAHPDATLTEIERELDRLWHARRVAVLAEVAQTGDEAVGDCPTCGTPLVQRGAHARTVRSDGDQAITLHRPYGWCPVCHTGLFPPG